MNTDAMPPQSAARPESLLLRPAWSGDAETLAALFIAARRAASPAMPASVHSEDEIRTWFAKLFLAGRDVWLAQRDDQRVDEVVGYLILDPAWLDSLYVRPELTGQGIGTALLDLAKGLRPGGFSLWVFESNLRAQRFYETHGLLRLERTDGSENEEQAPDIRMVWPGERPVEVLRALVNEVDVDLGRVLARRAALTAAIQRHKDVPGHAGRDHEREAEIAQTMAAHAPNLGPERIAAIMDAVITASLDAADQPPR